MTNTAPRLGSLYFSNLGDAAGTKLFDTVVSLTVVLHLGFSATQLGLLNFLGALSFFLTRGAGGHHCRSHRRGAGAAQQSAG